MKFLHSVSFILLIVGGLNWLAFGLFKWQIGDLFGGGEMTVSRIIYVLVGLATVWILVNHKKDCKWCSSMGNSSQGNGMR